MVIAIALVIQIVIVAVSLEYWLWVAREEGRLPVLTMRVHLLLEKDLLVKPWMELDLLLMRRTEMHQQEELIQLQKMKRRVS